MWGHFIGVVARGKPILSHKGIRGMRTNRLEFSGRTYVANNGWGRDTLSRVMYLGGWFKLRLQSYDTWSNQEFRKTKPSDNIGQWVCCQSEPQLICTCCLEAKTMKSWNDGMDWWVTFSIQILVVSVSFWTLANPLGFFSIKVTRHRTLPTGKWQLQIPRIKYARNRTTRHTHHGFWSTVCSGTHNLSFCKITRT